MARTRYTRRISEMGTSMSDEQEELYEKAIAESEGFDVPRFPGVRTSIKPADHESEKNNERFKLYAKKAIDDYKSNVDKNADPEFVRVVKTNYSIIGASLEYYVTFEAIDHGQLKTYQALIWYMIGDEDVSVKFCRLKPTPA